MATRSADGSAKPIDQRRTGDEASARDQQPHPQVPSPFDRFIDPDQIGPRRGTGSGFIIGPAIGGLLGEYSVRLPFICAAALAIAPALIYGRR